MRGAKFLCGTPESPRLRRVAVAPQQCVQLQRASLQRAQLQGASLDGAQLQGALLKWARLQGASLKATQLQGAVLTWARLQGASLDDARLQGAVLDNAFLQGAWLSNAQMQGAWLGHAQLWGATLDWTQLQGARLDHAFLQAARLENAELQGASLDDAQLQGASFRDIFVWRADARKAHWENTRLVNPETGPKQWPEQSESLTTLQAGKLPEAKQWSAELFEKLKKIIAYEVPEGEKLREASKTTEYILRPKMALEVKVGFKDRRAALERIEQRLDPAKALEGEEEMAKVWKVQASSFSRH